MILDTAEDLRQLVARAEVATDHSERVAALATVQHEIEVVHRTVASYAVAGPPWYERLPDEARAELALRAADFVAALEPLHGATDDVLATYAAGDASARGRLAAIKRERDRLRQALNAAQDALLSCWIDAIWPSDDEARLQVLLHVPGTRDNAGVIVGARRALADRRSDDRWLTQGDLEQLSRRASEATTLARAVVDTEVPDEVVSFWHAATAGPEGVPLTALTVDVHAWLERHGALETFRIFAER